MNKIFLFLILLLLVIVPVSADYTATFDSTSNVRVNQSYVQDPTQGNAVPWTLWVASGFLGLTLLVLSLIRPKTMRMDYEVNIIISILSWPFCWYFAWGGMTSVDYVVGVGVTATSSDTTIMMTQHILYNFWLLGLIGVVGSVFAVFVTALLASQYNLFNENEERAAAKQRQEDAFR